MSKQSEAKKAQKYNPKPQQPECQNCFYYNSEIKERVSAYGGNTYKDEKKLRCGLGGFAIKKKGTCNKHIFKNQATKKYACFFADGPHLDCVLDYDNPDDCYHAEKGMNKVDCEHWKEYVIKSEQNPDVEPNISRQKAQFGELL